MTPYKLGKLTNLHYLSLFDYHYYFVVKVEASHSWKLLASKSTFASVFEFKFCESLCDTSYAPLIEHILIDIFDKIISIKPQNSSSFSLI